MAATCAGSLCPLAGFRECHVAPTCSADQNMVVLCLVRPGIVAGAGHGWDRRRWGSKSFTKALPSTGVTLQARLTAYPLRQEHKVDGRVDCWRQLLQPRCPAMPGIPSVIKMAGATVWEIRDESSGYAVIPLAEVRRCHRELATPGRSRTAADALPMDYRGAWNVRGSTGKSGAYCTNEISRTGEDVTWVAYHCSGQRSQ